MSIHEESRRDLEIQSAKSIILDLIEMDQAMREKNDDILTTGFIDESVRPTKQAQLIEQLKKIDLSLLNELRGSVVTHHLEEFPEGILAEAIKEIELQEAKKQKKWHSSMEKDLIEREEALSAIMTAGGMFSLC